MGKPSWKRWQDGKKGANFGVLLHGDAILVDRGNLSVVLAGAATDGFPHRVALYFLGGPNDREALALATYMAEDAPIGLTVFRFLPPPEWRKGGDPEEDRLDEEALQEYVSRWVDDTAEPARTAGEEAAAVAVGGGGMFFCGRGKERECFCA